MNIRIFNNTMEPGENTKGKGKGMVLYSAVSSPLDRSKRFTLSSPDRPVHSDTVLGFSTAVEFHTNRGQHSSETRNNTILSTTPPRLKERISRGIGILTKLNNIIKIDN